MLFAEIDFPQDQGEDLGNVDEVAQGVVGIQDAKEQLEKKGQPVRRQRRVHRDFSGRVQGKQADIAPFEMDPEDAPGIYGIGKIAVPGSRRDAEGIPFFQYNVRLPG